MELDELTLDNLAKKPLRIRVTALALIFLIILFFIYWLLLKPRLFQLTILKKQEQDLKNTYQSQKIKVAKLPSYEQEWILARSIDATILRQLVDNHEFSDLLKKISKLSVESNLEIVTLKPEPEIMQPLYMAIPLRIDLKGDFLDITQFLNQMVQLPKLIILQDMAFTAIPNTHGVFLKMKAMAYRYSGEKINGLIQADLPDSKILTVKNKNWVFQRDPFSLSQTVLDSDENILSKYTLSSLRMVGIVEYHRQRWALIATEENIVFRVTVGMHLGERGGRVVEIDNHQLKIRQTASNGEKRMASLSLNEE